METHSIVLGLGLGAFLQITIAVFVGIRISKLIDWLSERERKESSK